MPKPIPACFGQFKHCKKCSVARQCRKETEAALVKRFNADPCKPAVTHPTGK